MRKSPLAGIPSFTGEGRSDRDGTAVFVLAGGGVKSSAPTDTTEPKNTTPVLGEFVGHFVNGMVLKGLRVLRRSGKRQHRLRGDRTSSTDRDIILQCSPCLRVVDLSPQYLVSCGSYLWSMFHPGTWELWKRTLLFILSIRSRGIKTSCVHPTDRGKGISIWAPELKEGKEYVSDEHDVRISVPDQGCGDAEQFTAGPVLLERTAEVVECEGDDYFITSIVHYFPFGTSFAEPLVLEFGFEASDEVFVVDSLKVRFSLRLQPIFFVSSKPKQSSQKWRYVQSNARVFGELDMGGCVPFCPGARS